MLMINTANVFCWLLFLGFQVLPTSTWVAAIPRAWTASTAPSTWNPCNHCGHHPFPLESNIGIQQVLHYPTPLLFHLEIPSPLFLPGGNPCTAHCHGLKACHIRQGHCLASMLMSFQKETREHLLIWMGNMVSQTCLQRPIEMLLPENKVARATKFQNDQNTKHNREDADVKRWRVMEKLSYL